MGVAGGYADVYKGRDEGDVVIGGWNRALRGE